MRKGGEDQEKPKLIFCAIMECPCESGRSGTFAPKLPERGNCNGMQHYLSFAAMPVNRYKWQFLHLTMDHTNPNLSGTQEAG